MSPVLPGSLPAWVTPSRIVVVTQSISLLFMVGVFSEYFSLSSSSSALFFGLLVVSFFFLSLVTRGQCTLLSVAAAYGEVGAWFGSLLSFLLFFYVFFFNVKVHGATSIIFGISCAILLGWLPGLLAGFILSLGFWLAGGWMFASLQQQRQFPALDDTHRMLVRAGFWLLCLSAISLYRESFFWALNLFLWGSLSALMAMRSLRERDEWLSRVRAQLEPHWKISPASSLALRLMPLSNYSQQNEILFYQDHAHSPYRSTDNETPIAIC
jgi:hypothetical protein